MKVLGKIQKPQFLVKKIKGRKFLKMINRKMYAKQIRKDGLGLKTAIERRSVPFLEKYDKIFENV